MIYAKTNDGGIFIGLSEGNLKRLRKGDPILRVEVGKLPTLRIVYGKTENDILDMLVTEGIMEKEVAEFAKADLAQRPNDETNNA